MPLSTAIFWLKAASAALLIAFGVLFALAAFPSAAAPALFFLDTLIWPIDGTQSLAGAEPRILAAIGGGIAAGWGVLVWQVAHHLMPRDPQTARRILLTSLFTWFAVDSACSVLAGVALNAGANVVFLAVFLWPLWRMEKSASAVAA